MKQLFFTYQRHIEIAFWIFVQNLHAIINANSILHEYVKRGEVIEKWQPYLWELSSQVGILLLLPLLIVFNQRFPLYPANFKQNILPHIFATFAFSIAHILLMVAVRKVFYVAMGTSYDFGDWRSEFFYEYRKDVLTYIGIIITIYVYRFIIARIKGEATIVNIGEHSNKKPDRLLVKKLGKEFVIQIQDIEWIEAAGNYMNIHVQGSIYPLRGTMSGLTESLSSDRFVRVHRSYMINIDFIDHIEPNDSADATIHLKTGQPVKLSRRYKESFQFKLSAS